MNAVTSTILFCPKITRGLLHCVHKSCILVYININRSIGDLQYVQYKHIFVVHPKNSRSFLLPLMLLVSFVLIPNYGHCCTKRGVRKPTADLYCCPTPLFRRLLLIARVGLLISTRFRGKTGKESCPIHKFQNMTKTAVHRSGGVPIRLHFIAKSGSKSCHARTRAFYAVCTADIYLSATISSCWPAGAHFSKTPTKRENHVHSPKLEPRIFEFSSP